MGARIALKAKVARINTLSLVRIDLLIMASRTSRAFTLLELIVVLAIIGVLVALIFPAVKNMRQGSNRTVAVSQLRKISAGINLYALENDWTYPKADALPSDGFWAHSIARNPGYLGPAKQWLHQELVAPGVLYSKAGGGTYTTEELRMTYTTTGVMCDMVGPYLTTKTGRKLSLVRAPSRAPLVFLARQRPGNDGYSRSVVHGTEHVEVARDLAALRAQDTVLFNFDLGLMPVLMADGHVEAVAFHQLKDFVQQDTWQSRP